MAQTNVLTSPLAEVLDQDTRYQLEHFNQSSLESILSSLKDGVSQAVEWASKRENAVKACAFGIGIGLALGVGVARRVR